jgi:molybdate transport system substrate-binding protein
LGAGLFLVGTIATTSACTSGGTDEVQVFAAASLTDAFTAIESGFESAHPGADVSLNFAGSSTLREQILEGAPADVFASADAANMQNLVEAGRISGSPEVFASNRLAIAVPPGNPGAVTSLADFTRPELLIGICAPALPCGEFARQALEAAGVEAEIDTYEADVRALLTKVEAGELDAGIVYVTDLVAAGARTQGLEIPAAYNVVAEYPIAVLTDAPHSRLASDFHNYVLSAAGREALADYGFGPP